MAIVRENLIESGDELHYELISDHADIHNANDELKKATTRGFSPDRHFQHIGAVPCDVWHQHAKKIGYYMMDNVKRKEEVIRFLNQFRQWSPVEAIRTTQPNETSIIIK